MVMVVV